MLSQKINALKVVASFPHQPLPLSICRLDQYRSSPFTCLTQFLIGHPVRSANEEVSVHSNHLLMFHFSASKLKANQFLAA